MITASSPRRSARARKAKKYTDDAFEALGMNTSMPSFFTTPPSDWNRNVDAEDDEYSANPGPPERELGEEEDGEELSDVDDMDLEDPGTPGTPPSEDNAMPARRRRRVGLALQKRKSQPRNVSNQHFRGVVEPVHYRSKEDRVKYHFGSGEQEILSLVQSRDRWVEQPTMPIKSVDGLGRGGMCESYSRKDEVKWLEARKGWEWYYEKKGKTRFTTAQQVEHLSFDEGRHYLPTSAKKRHSFLMGPNGRQNIFSLNTGDSMKLDDAWTGSRGSRRGWITYLGGRISCMDWAPNQNSESQYLAVAITGPENQPPSQRPAANERDARKAPGFRSLAPKKASIQIWQFSANGGESIPEAERGRPALEKLPKLRWVGGTEWGSVNRLSWCPMPREDRGQEQGKVSLGLLGTIWGDGKVRVLDVDLDNRWGEETEYLKFNGAAFEAYPPDSLCTCLTWLSSTDLAVGCANGFVAIWNIAPLSQAKDGTSIKVNHHPWFYHMIHPTYILAISSAYPGQPHLIATSSMDGFNRLTDLRAPFQDTVSSLRTRIGTPVLAFHDATQSFATTDEVNFVRLYPVRRFFSACSIASASSNLLSIACSTTHASMMAASSGGAVLVTNPTRKILQPRKAQFQQVWFIHEWTRNKGGLSRFNEGFKIEPAELLNSQVGDQTSGSVGIISATIYDEEIGVNLVTWNPNVICGGWATAAMGSGLLRVEDIAL
ncbi:MAG: hypothetical protein M1834_002296 [Cirrosporium novae-zelandiae]|nr:MAG: hypothetical protein M1834_002296 [Cirrosporium novae-zelandiae]